MKNTFMITPVIAALLVGGGMALAQGVIERHDVPVAATPDAKKRHGETAVPKNPVIAAPPAQALEKATEPHRGIKRETSGQGMAAPSSQAAPPARTELPAKGSAPTAAAKGNQAPAVFVAALSAEQHVKFRDSVRGEKVERLTKAPFAISVGQFVPRNMQLHRLPVGGVDYAPQYRGYEYLLVGDEILLVDPATFRIVAVIAN